MKRILSVILVVILLCTFSVSSFAQQKNVDTGDRFESIYTDKNGDTQKVVITTNGDITVYQQFDSKGNLVDTCETKKGLKTVNGYNEKNGKYSFTVKNNYSKSNIEKTSTPEVSSLVATAAPTLGYTYLGYQKFISGGFSGYKYMKTSVWVTEDGTTTYSLSSGSGTLISIVAGIAVGLVVPSIVANSLAQNIIGAGLGYLVGEIFHISTTIPLSCIQYTHSFTSHDLDRPLNYNTGTWVGHQYVINDIQHPELNNSSYKDTYITDDYYNHTTQLFMCLFFSVYEVDGTPVFN